ncbi:50S ribosomal protein L18 [bacterium]|jgi:large subunit ribosomal protein L18|nr:50S ribosomal protein L18 [bacterium]MBT6832364.1 50S ribosomal protein L18 [bacterium]MBT6995909.1 50S ribosomal protein L18 [bacterium]MBT7772770.1 50S ribosomal protein L18 [bacterium]
MAQATKHERTAARARRTHTRARLSGLPRLIVLRSNRAISAHIMDDDKGITLCGVSSLGLKKTGIPAAAEVGTKIAELAKTKKVKCVAFDRSGFQYHGQIKALADAARKAGLEF